MSVEGEFDPRVWIHNEMTGSREPVLASDVHGLDEFLSGWQNDVDDPHLFDFEAWQLSDDEHPPGKGVTGYRIVWKTIRTVTAPNVEFTMPNLRVMFATGVINFGEPRYEGTLRDRSAGAYLLPEWGEIGLHREGHGYLARRDMSIRVEAHQGETPPGNYVEVLYSMPEDFSGDFAATVAAGRAAVAPLLLMLDLVFGDRTLGAVITEEVGELFDDWHWNRRLGGRRIRMESQAQMNIRTAEEVGGELQRMMEVHLSRGVEAGRRLRIASQWYWEADAQPDPVLRYIAYWLALEALELDENANIQPLKATVASLLAAESWEIAEPLGRLYSLRSKLVHGKVRSVDEGMLEKVRDVAIALLEYRSLGELTTARHNRLAIAMELGGPEGAAA